MLELKALQKQQAEYENDKINMISSLRRSKENMNFLVTVLVTDNYNPKQDRGQQGCLGGSVAERLPSVQGVIPDFGIESHIRVPVRSLILPLPVSLPLSLCCLWISK